MHEGEALDVLVHDGFIRYDVTRFRTTRRWQAALARAAFHLQRSGAPWQDLRVPIAAALAGEYRDRTDDDLASLVEAILPIETAELAPLVDASAGR